MKKATDTATDKKASRGKAPTVAAAAITTAATAIEEDVRDVADKQPTTTIAQEDYGTCDDGYEAGNEDIDVAIALPQSKDATVAAKRTPLIPSTPPQSVPPTSEVDGARKLSSSRVATVPSITTVFPLADLSSAGIAMATSTSAPIASEPISKSKLANSSSAIDQKKGKKRKAEEDKSKAANTVEATMRSRAPSERAEQLTASDALHTLVDTTKAPINEGGNQLPASNGDVELSRVAQKSWRGGKRDEALSTSASPAAATNRDSNLDTDDDSAAINVGQQTSKSPAYPPNERQQTKSSPFRKQLRAELSGAPFGNDQPIKESNRARAPATSRVESAAVKPLQSQPPLQSELLSTSQSQLELSQSQSHLVEDEDDEGEDGSEGDDEVALSAAASDEYNVDVDVDDGGDDGGDVGGDVSVDSAWSLGKTKPKAASKKAAAMSTKTGRKRGRELSFDDASSGDDDGTAKESAIIEA
jgi:hypothetical protein